MGQCLVGIGVAWLCRVSDAAKQPRGGQNSTGLSRMHHVLQQDSQDVSLRTAEHTGHRGWCPHRHQEHTGRGIRAPLPHSMQTPDLFRLEQFVVGCNFNYLRAEEPIRACAHRGFYEFP